MIEYNKTIVIEVLMLMTQRKIWLTFVCQFSFTCIRIRVLCCFFFLCFFCCNNFFFLNPDIVIKLWYWPPCWSYKNIFCLLFGIVEDLFIIQTRIYGPTLRLLLVSKLIVCLSLSRYPMGKSCREHIIITLSFDDAAISFTIRVTSLRWWLSPPTDLMD